ncbi:MAG: DNA polymerase III subunit delta [Bacteroidales bacterium]
MLFRDVIGQRDIIRQLIHTVEDNRISHAQMLLGPEGTGNMALALAYSQFINCSAKRKIDEQIFGFSVDACGECPSCQKIQNLSHPDLHFIFPLPADLRKAKKDNKANELIYEPWRNLIQKTAGYFGINDLHNTYNLKGKQTIISAEDCNEIIQKVSLHSYEGGYKIVIIWMPEKLFYSAAPKILKTLEEPPDKTLFLLVAEQQEMILNTILSRTQIIQVPRLKDEEIREALIEHNQTDPGTAHAATMLASGSYSRALKHAGDTAWLKDNLNQFMTLTRLSFEIHKKFELEKTQATIQWVNEMSKKGREYQKNFLNYAIRLFREAILTTYQTPEINKINREEQEFMKRFYKVINHANILNITDEFEKAVYAIERNGNANLIFMDLCFFLNRQLRKGYKALIQ